LLALAPERAVAERHGALLPLSFERKRLLAVADMLVAFRTSGSYTGERERHGAILAPVVARRDMECKRLVAVTERLV
jgi:hypothetical protein